MDETIKMLDAELQWLYDEIKEHQEITDALYKKIEYQNLVIEGLQAQLDLKEHQLTESWH